jgi:hypothetical protein
MNHAGLICVKPTYAGPVVCHRGGSDCVRCNGCSSRGRRIDEVVSALVKSRRGTTLTERGYKAQDRYAHGIMGGWTLRTTRRCCRYARPLSNSFTTDQSNPQKLSQSTNSIPIRLPSLPAGDCHTTLAWAFWPVSRRIIWRHSRGSAE